MLESYHIPFTRIRIGRFLFLLVTITLMFVARPFLGGFIRVAYLMDIFFTAIFISGVYAVSQRKSIFIPALLVALAATLFRWLSHLMEISVLDLIGDILGGVFLAWLGTLILVYLFTEKQITGDLIIGAICVYFLIGFVWSLFFSLLENFQPGSFVIGGTGGKDTAEFVYYSFVTMTTLGYGDITPISTPARSLAMLEAVMGQLYIAVLIARLVGIHISQSQNSGSTS